MLITVSTDCDAPIHPGGDVRCITGSSLRSQSCECWKRLGKPILTVTAEVANLGSTGKHLQFIVQPASIPYYRGSYVLDTFGAIKIDSHWIAQQVIANNARCCLRLQSMEPAGADSSSIFQANFTSNLRRFTQQISLLIALSLTWSLCGHVRLSNILRSLR